MATKEIPDTSSSRRWDERYKNSEFAYGRTPNLFFKEWLTKLEPGSILMPADGEGRNGVYAAHLGWRVTSFDLSAEGKSKALQLAKENSVALQYHVGDFEHLAFEPQAFDAIGLIYAHFPADKKRQFHRKLDAYLKPGGFIIFEAFGKQHIHYNTPGSKVGGPKDTGSLFSTEEIRQDFENYDILLLTEKVIELNEGQYHIGRGSVVRFAGRKRLQ
jgi:SAM-dependent methyltransferase